MKTAGIYIHIPFCENKSIYCDYYSIEKRGNNIGVFVEMLQREIELSAKDHEMDWIFNKSVMRFISGKDQMIKSKKRSNVKLPVNKR